MAVDLSAALLAWYDVHARVLPWRSPPGTAAPDPYRVWLSEVMLQQTVTAVVGPYFTRFLARWPSVAALAAADDAEVMREWAGLGYYARARNLLACARTVTALGWPATEAGLRALPGIGGYTAAAVAAIAFGQRAVVVDGNVERVVSRLFAVETPLPAARRLLYDLAAALTPGARAGDHAQALMDLGATVCTPRAPRCGACPLAADCAGRASGTPERFPVRAARTPKPVRFGTAWWIECDGLVLLERRPASGLLGGMLGLPGTAWSTAPAAAPAPVAVTPAATVRHVFTHFELRLAVAVAHLPGRPDLPGEWYPVARLAAAGLPTLFVRAAAAVLRERAVGGLSRPRDGAAPPPPPALETAA